MAAVREYGTPLVDDPGRLDGVAGLSVDETAFLAANGKHHTEFVTGMIDVTRSRLLDVAPGRSGPVLCQWISAPHPFDPHQRHRPASHRQIRTYVGRRSCSRACTPQPRQKSVEAVVSTACSSSPSCCDTASRTKPSNPSIAVAALTSSCTWGLLESCPHTTNREAPGPFPGSGRSSCHHRATTLH
jgi:hypothetical protein